jgi:hypothetical protein
LRRLEEPQRINPLLVFVLLLGLFFTHLITYLEAGLFLVGIIMQDKDARTRLRLAVPAVVSGFLPVWYFAARLFSNEVAGKSWRWWPDLNSFIGGAIYPVFLFWEFSPPRSVSAGVAPVGAILNLVWLLAIGGIMFLAAKLAFNERHEKKTKLIMRVAAAYGILIIVTGYRLALANIGERFVYPSLWLTCCWLGSQPRASFLTSKALFPKVLLIGLIVTQCLWLNYDVSHVCDKLNAIFTQLRSSRQESLRQFCDTYESYLPRNEPADHAYLVHVMLPRILPVGDIPYYIYVEDNSAAPSFPTGLLEFQGRGNYDNLCEGSRTDRSSPNPRSATPR